MTSGHDQSNDQAAGAVQALRDRGVNQPERLLEHATADQVLAACRRWDGESNVQPGLLVHWIRSGEIPEQPARSTTRHAAATEPTEEWMAWARRRIDELALLNAYGDRYPIGTVLEEPHGALVDRGVHGGQACRGGLAVVIPAGPGAMLVRCDRCDAKVRLGVAYLTRWHPLRREAVA